jgi:hypothetical protein
VVVKEERVATRLNRKFLLKSLVMKIVDDYSTKVPSPMSYTIDTTTASSLHIFRGQEIDRFNKLLKTLKKSLEDLRQAIGG